METALADQHELSKQMFSMLKELTSNKADPEYRASNPFHNETLPVKEKVDSNNKSQEIDLDPSSVFYVDPHIVSIVPISRSVVSSVHIETPEEPIPEIDCSTLHSPAKRRDFSVTEEIHLEEKKEQKIPKRKISSLPTQQQVPQVFFVSLPDDSTITFSIEQYPFLGNAIRDMHRSTRENGYLTLNGIPCRPRDRPVPGRTYIWSIRMKGGMRRLRKLAETDSESDSDNTIAQQQTLDTARSDNLHQSTMPNYYFASYAVPSDTVPEEKKLETSISPNSMKQTKLNFFYDTQAIAPNNTSTEEHQILEDEKLQHYSQHTPDNMVLEEKYRQPTLEETLGINPRNQPEKNPSGMKPFSVLQWNFYHLNSGKLSIFPPKLYLKILISL